MLRPTQDGPQILAFRRPRAGVQLVKGNVEPREEAGAAALRELAEESGIGDAAMVRRLGSSRLIADGQSWHFFLCRTAALRDAWVHRAADDGGHDCRFGWWPLSQEPDAALWHEIFIRALQHIGIEIGEAVPDDPGWPPCLH